MASESTSPKGRHLLIRKVLQTFELPDDMDNFNYRHNKQKLFAWLVDAGTVQIPHTFRWYIHGPYSPDLAQDLFFLAEKGADIDRVFEGFEFSPQLSDALTAQKEKLGTRIQDKEFMEALGSMAFLQTSGVPRDLLVAELARKKPQLDRDLITRVYGEFFAAT